MQQAKTKLIGKYRKGGVFMIDLPTGRKARIIVSNEYQGHVSVYTGEILPLWSEMEFIKQKTFGNNRAYQIHPEKAEYVNVAEVLHIWGNIE